MAVMLAAVLAAASCSSRPSAAAPVRFAASRSIAANGLSVTVFVSRQQLGIADRLEVLIEARRQDGEAVQWPSLLTEAQRGSPFPPNPADPEVSDWSVVDLTRRTLSPGHESMEIVLEPYLAGDKPFPALTFKVSGKQVATEAIPVTVVAEHAAQSDAEADPLAALAAFDPPLKPLPPRGSWFASPLTWAVVAVLTGALLCGGAAVAVVRSRKQHAQSPDQQLDRILMLGGAAVAGTDPTHAEEVAEKATGALRVWLAATGRTSPGTTGSELLAWIRATPLASASELAESLAAYEAYRFAPGRKASLEETRRLVRAAWEFSHELRSESQRRAREGGSAA
jgi:hypothetical protein